MKDFRINPDETDREREIRICQSPAQEAFIEALNDKMGYDVAQTIQEAADKLKEAK